MEDEQSGNNDIVSTLGNTSLHDRDSDDEESAEQILKLVVVGDGTVGKSSLCTRFAQKNFNKKYAQVCVICEFCFNCGKYFQTIGVDFFSRRILLPHNVSVLLQVLFHLFIYRTT